MGFPRPFFRRAVAIALATALPAFMLTVAAPVASSADTVLPTPVSGDALPTAQVDGVVWTQVVSQGVDFVGGSFDSSQPAGAAAGVDVVPRSNLFAYDVTTGAAVDGFHATANAQVRAVAASADGSTIYVAGDFTEVNGVPRKHVAAIDRSGDLLAWAPSVNAAVYSLAVRGDRVYLGGAFTQVAGTARSRAAAVSTAGTLLAWEPAVADYVVRAIAVSPDSAKVLLAGNFTAVGGVTTARGMAATDASTGAVLPWSANALVFNHGGDSAFYSLSSRGTTVYVTGYVYGTQQDGNLEGTLAMSWSDGSVVWVEDCHGDTYSSVPFNGAVYTASHAHYCGNIGGFGESDPKVYHRALAFSQVATGTVQPNAEGPYFDFGGRPAPTLLDWYPELKAGTFTGMSQAAWSVAAGGSYVVFGGEFTEVGGVRQTGLVRYLGSPEPADDAPVVVPPAGPTESPRRVSKPSTVALGPSRVAVRWKAPAKARADEVTGYVVRIRKGASVVRTVSTKATTRQLVVTGLSRSTRYTVSVSARNAVGTGTASARSTVRTKAKGRTVSAVKRPSTPAKPSASRGRTSVRATWHAASVKGALPVTHYQVRLVRKGGTTVLLTVDDRLRTALLKHLKRHTTYSVSVRAGSWAGWGHWSKARSVRTR